MQYVYTRILPQNRVYIYLLHSVTSPLACQGRGCCSPLEVQLSLALWPASPPAQGGGSVMEVGGGRTAHN